MVMTEFLHNGVGCFGHSALVEFASQCCSGFVRSRSPDLRSHAGGNCSSIHRRHLQDIDAKTSPTFSQPWNPARSIRSSIILEDASSQIFRRFRESCWMTAMRNSQATGSIRATRLRMSDEVVCMIGIPAKARNPQRSGQPSLSQGSKRCEFLIITTSDAPLTPP